MHLASGRKQSCYPARCNLQHFDTCVAVCGSAWAPLRNRWSLAPLCVGSYTGTPLTPAHAYLFVRVALELAPSRIKTTVYPTRLERNDTVFIKSS